MKKLLAILFVATLVSCGGSTSVETISSENGNDSITDAVSVTEAVSVTSVDSTATE